MRFHLTFCSLVYLFLSGCNSGNTTSINDYLSVYLAEGNVKIENDKITNFVELYDGLEKVSVSKKVKVTYAELLYFDDTLVTLHKRSELIDYLVKTQKRLDGISVELLNSFEKDDDVFVHWKMLTIFTLFGQEYQIESIGISHLRFDQSGKIILHQDYWDSTKGFFQHLPVVGGLLLWIKQSVH